MHCTTIAAAVLMLAATVPALAGNPQNQIPSCYAANKMEIKPAAPVRSFFVVLDETVVLDENLQRALWEQVRPQLQPSTEFAVLRFSAFSQGKYLEVVASGVIEASVPAQDRDSVSVPKLKTFDACMKGQADYAQNLAKAAIGKVLQAASFELSRSDIEGSLQALSHIVAEARSSRRTLLLVSDMLENSSVSSFYQNNGVRRIDATAEMKKAEAEKMLGNFGGASVYVMGAGVIAAPNAKGKPGVQYRDAKTMAALQDFWSRYFSSSNAKLMEFGAPALLSTIPKD
jgi:hypothetical protein